MTATLSWSGVTARRMARHALAEPATDLGSAAVAGLLCGAHAQVLSAAELSIGRRIAGATRADVQHALWQDRSLVKTFGPRGTVHLLPAADLPMWTGALSALPSPVPIHPEGVRFTPDQADEVIAAIGDALADTELTVDELTEALADRPGPWAVERTMDAFQDKWPRWRQLTSTAAHRGVLCFGPDRGRKVTYTNPHRWLPGFRPAGGDAALRTLVTRYLHTYGPASPAHFARWIGVPPRYAATVFGDLAPDLERVELDGDPAWTCAGDTVTPPEPHRGVRLLPYFDPYVVAGQPRERLYPGAAAARALTPSGQAGNYPVLLVDGEVGGVWHPRRSGRKLVITVEPLGELTARQRRGLDDEATLVGAVMEATPTLTVGPVTVGPHA
jgi:winged helix DNA-binding protein